MYYLCIGIDNRFLRGGAPAGPIQNNTAWHDGEGSNADRCPHGNISTIFFQAPHSRCMCPLCYGKLGSEIRCRGWAIMRVLVSPPGIDALLAVALGGKSRSVYMIFTRGTVRVLLEVRFLYIISKLGRSVVFRKKFERKYGSGSTFRKLILFSKTAWNNSFASS